MEELAVTSIRGRLVRRLCGFAIEYTSKNPTIRTYGVPNTGIQHQERVPAARKIRVDGHKNNISLANDLEAMSLQRFPTSLGF